VTSDSQYQQQESERQFLERLRTRYEDEGFTFTAPPETRALPDFLGSYVPDALAQKPGHHVAIEVKRRPSPSTERALKDIRRLFEGHPDWQLHVFFMGTDPLQSVTIPAAAPGNIRDGIDQVRSLAGLGHRRPAFVLAWSLLEAALVAVLMVRMSREGGESRRPRTPGTVVQTLAMNGYVGPDVEQRLRNLIDLRNRIVHGDLTAAPSAEDIELVLSAVEQTLSADAT
jgi:hypothetical protein